MRIGRAEIQTAVKDSPTYYQGHLFYGLVLENQDHNNKAAVAQFNDFVADGPRRAELAQVGPAGRSAPMRRRDVPVPPAPSRRGRHADLSPVGTRRSPTTRGEGRGERVRSPPRCVGQPTLTRSEWLGSTPIASSTGEGSMLSDEQAEPEWTATPARSRPISTGSASTPCTPRQTSEGSRSSGCGRADELDPVDGERGAEHGDR